MTSNCHSSVRRCLRGQRWGRSPGTAAVVPRSPAGSASACGGRREVGMPAGRSTSPSPCPGRSVLCVFAPSLRGSALALSGAERPKEGTRDGWWTHGLRRVVRTTRERAAGLRLLLPEADTEEREFTAGGNAACWLSAEFVKHSGWFTAAGSQKYLREGSPRPAGSGEGAR